MHFLQLPKKHLIFVLPEEAQVSCLVPRRVLADWRATGSWYHGKRVHPSQSPFSSTLNVPMVHCAILLLAATFFRFPNTLETLRNRQVPTSNANTGTEIQKCTCITLYPNMTVEHFPPCICACD